MLHPHLQHADPAALYNIGVVSRMTGIPVATLRVWERRYGFPTSERTDGGHRIYSEHEVQRLRWVKERIDEGMQTGQAVRALEHLEAKPPQAPPAVSSAPSAEALPASTLIPHRQRFLRALLAHDLAGADQLLGEILPLYALERIVLELIQPSLAAIGEGWAAGQISVATEHLASHYLRQRLLAWTESGPELRASAPTVLACAPGDWHETGLLMLALLLRRKGWPIDYLGPSLPLSDLASFVRGAQPAAVVLVATVEEPARALADWPQYLPELASSGRPPVCFAGRAFALDGALREAMPGIYLGDSLEAGLSRLVEILERGA
jgi:DNA-binding transcriptional MerR regulator